MLPPRLSDAGLAPGGGSRGSLRPGWAAALGVLVLAVAVVTGLAGGSGPGSSDDAPRPTPTDGTALRPRPGSGPPLPDVTLAAFEGEGVVRTADLEGTPVVVNFWASWCPLCVEEMPDFETVHRRFEGSVAFLGVDLQDDPGLAADLARRTGVTYPLAVDRDGELFAAVQGLGMPTTLLVTADGRIAEHVTGPLDADSLERLVLEHLVEEVRAG